MYTEVHIFSGIFFTLVFTFVIKTDILGQFLKFDTMLTILKEGRMVNKLCMRF